MWSDWLVFCDCGFNLSALWCPSVPTVLLGFLLPWTWGISSVLLQQSTATAPYLGRGHSSLLWMQAIVYRMDKQGPTLHNKWTIFNIWWLFTMENNMMNICDTAEIKLNLIKQPWGHNSQTHIVTKPPTPYFKKTFFLCHLLFKNRSIIALDCKEGRSPRMDAFKLWC